MELDNFHAAGRAVLLAFGLLCFFSNPYDAEGQETAAPVVEREALAFVKGANVGVLILGIEAEHLSGLKVLSGSVAGNASLEFANGQGVVINAKLAQQLSLRTGDIVALLNPVGDVTPMGNVPRITRYRVLAIVGEEIPPAANGVVYMRRAEAEKFSGADQ